MTVLAPIVSSWDGPNRLIYLTAAVGDYFPIEDLYHEYRNARRLDESLRGFDALMKAEGNVPKGAGAFTPRYVVLLDGTKIVPFNNTTQINQLGDIITDDPDTDPELYDTTALTVPKVIYIKPSEAETIQLNSIAIEYSSYDNGVTFDMANGVAGTEYPIGTARQPSSNQYDSATIAQMNGFTKGYILGDLTLVTDLPLVNFEFIGQGRERTTLTVPVGSQLSDCTFIRMCVTGEIAGESSIRDSAVQNLSGVHGFIESSVLEPGTITLAGEHVAHFLNCWSGQPGTGTPIIDMNGTGSALALRGYTGGIKLINKSGPESATIDLISGQVIIDDTVTSGDIVLRGIGKWTNKATYVGGANVIDELVSQDQLDAIELAGSDIKTIINSIEAKVDIVDANIDLIQIDVTDVWQAAYHRRMWNKVANTITIYQADGTSVKTVFDANADLSDINPQ